MKYFHEAQQRLNKEVREHISITRAGSDLLFRVLRQSTIGVKGFHCRVRDGIECISFAITTGSRNAILRRGEVGINEVRM